MAADAAVATMPAGLFGTSVLIRICSDEAGRNALLKLIPNEDVSSGFLAQTSQIHVHTIVRKNVFQKAVCRKGRSRGGVATNVPRHGVAGHNEARTVRSFHN